MPGSSPRKLLVLAFAILSIGGARPAVPQVDEKLNAKRRVFKPIGPGLRAFHRSASGKYYAFTTSGGITIFDETGKQVGVFGGPSAASVANKTSHSLLAAPEDFDVDARDNLYVADRT